jgi:dTDP-4-dehydrorhamnose reductase
LSYNVVNLIERNIADFGLYHYCDNGAVSWYDFACAIAASARRKGWLTHSVQIEAITTAQYPTAAPRPAYSVLNASKACQRLQFVVCSWQENLEEFFSEYGDFFPAANHE